MFENPCDRGDNKSHDSTVRALYQEKFKDHAPLWCMKAMQNMKRDLDLMEVTFLQCALGGKYEKYTTLWYSRGLAPTLDNLHICTCRHGSHTDRAWGRQGSKAWKSAEAAAYPAKMNEILA